MTANDRDGGPDGHRIDRRRLLQLAGVGVGSISMTTIGSGRARAANACADGPYERTYAAETINLSRIAATKRNHKTVDDQPPAGAFTATGVNRGSASPPPGAGAQHPPTSGDLLTVGSQYDGVQDTFIIGPPLEDPPIAAPPDSQIAVGRSKTVQAINRKLAIFNQRSGRPQLEVPFERFFEPLITEEAFVTGAPIISDPRLRYDPNADRFVFSVFYMHFPAWNGSWLLAVSADSNPNGRWHLYRIGTYSGDWPDYPPLGLDQDAIYLTGLTIPQSFAIPDYDTELAIIDKQAAYNGDAVSVNHFTGLLRANGFNSVVRPAFQPYAGGTATPYHLLSAQPSDDQLLVWEVSNPLDDPSLTCHEIDVDPFSPPPPARQPGTGLSVDTLGGWVMNLDYNDGSLWTAHSIGYNWDDGTDETVAAIRWYEIDATTSAVVQSGTYGEPGTSYFLPHITTDGDRTLMSYNVSGPERYPSLAVAGRTVGFTQGAMEAAVEIQRGHSSVIHPTRFGRRGDAAPVYWSDESGVSVHPTTGHFWVTGPYSPDGDVPLDGEKPDQQQSHIAEVSFEPGKKGR